jgi:hypothetical protein
MYFLYDTEHSFYQQFLNLRNSLGCPAPMLLTQNYYNLTNIASRSIGEIVGSHSYWQHPVFPNTPWDPVDWFIYNTPQIGDENPYAILRLQYCAVAGKPFLMGEYNEPHPSFYQCEMVPELFAYSGFWGYDAVLLYSYSHDSDLSRRHWDNFFDIHCDPKIMVQLVPWTIAFRRGDISPSLSPVSINYKLEDIFDFDIETRSNWNPPLTIDGYLNSFCSFEHAIFRKDMNATETPPGNQYGINSPTGPVFISDTGELTWDNTNGVFTVAADGICAIVGSLSGEEISSGPLTTFLTQPDFASITAVALEESSLLEADSILLVAVGQSGNRNMGWNSNFTTVGNNWGDPPTFMEPVLGQIKMLGECDSSIVFTLDTLGFPLDTLPSEINNSKVAFNLVGDTPWYLLVRKEPTGIKKETVQLLNSLDLVYPNPFNYTLNIRYSVAERDRIEIKIYNLLGQLVKILIDNTQEKGTHNIKWDGRNESGNRVGSGIYCCQLKVGDTFVKTKKIIFSK